MKFLLFVNITAFLTNLWYLLAKGYTDLNFVAVSMTFVAIIMAICILIEDN